MMNRSEFQKRLPLYHYGELPSSEHLEIQEHLAGCADCAAAAGRLEAWMGEIRRASRIEASAGFWEAYRRKVRSRLPAAKARQAPPALWRPAVLVPLALVLTGGIGFLLAAHFSRPRPSIEAQINEPIPAEALELARNLDVLENLTFLERMDVLEENPPSHEGQAPDHRL